MYQKCTKNVPKNHKSGIPLVYLWYTNFESIWNRTRNVPMKKKKRKKFERQLTWLHAHFVPKVYPRYTNNVMIMCQRYISGIKYTGTILVYQAEVLSKHISGILLVYFWYFVGIFLVQIQHGSKLTQFGYTHNVPVEGIPLVYLLLAHYGYTNKMPEKCWDSTSAWYTKMYPFTRG